MKRLLVVCGPTASGKTSMAIQLAKHFRTEIISFDSRQFYRELIIGTARPSDEETKQVTHHFIAHKSIFDTYTVYDYVQDAIKKLEELFLTYDLLIAVGGSGLFIHGLINGLSEISSIPDEIRTKWRNLYRKEGLSALQMALQTLDFEAYQKIDIHNPHRILRALEVKDYTGISLFDLHSKHKKRPSFETFVFAINHQRNVLYERINQRVERMIAKGLKQEAISFYKHRILPPLQTVGYKEWYEGFEHNWSEDLVIEHIKRNTRRYAKRQITWFRNKTPAIWIDEQNFFKSVVKFVHNHFTI